MALVVLNGVRLATGIGVAWFSTILGASLLVGGVAALGGLHADVAVLFFVFAGAVTVASAIVRPSRGRQPAA
jgi:hypothetical protein